MSIEGHEDVAGLMRVGAVVAEARDAMAKAVQAGISTADLDAIGRDILRRHHARSAPQLAYNFPGATCISVNDAVAHGIPSTQEVLREGDLVNIDVSAELDGYWADSGASFAVGRVESRARLLLTTTKHALSDAMAEAKAGARMHNIGRAVQRRARKHGFSVIGDLCGHGVGRNIHEAPSVSNTYSALDRQRLHEGLVITIEPFLTTRATTVLEDDDGWTLRTPDGSIGAQFEHTLIITNGAPIVVTASA